MLDVQALKPRDLDCLSASEKDTLMLQMLSHIGEQSKAIQAKQVHIEQQDKALKFKDAKIEKITFEMQRLKNWQFGANSERMTAEQRQLFEDTLVEDQESLQAELDTLLGDKVADSLPRNRRTPRRQALPEHLRRVEHHHEPQDTTCECGKPMVRIGQDVSERLDIVPAEFFAHRQAHECAQGGAPSVVRSK